MTILIVLCCVVAYLVGVPLVARLANLVLGFERDASILAAIAWPISILILVPWFLARVGMLTQEPPVVPKIERAYSYRSPAEQHDQ